MPDRQPPADLDEALDAVLRGLTDARPADLRARVLARIAGDAGDAGVGPSPARVRWSVALPAAAVIAAVAWSGWWASPRNIPPPTGPAAAAVAAARPAQSPASPSIASAVRPAPAPAPDRAPERRRGAVSARGRALTGRLAESTHLAVRSRPDEEDEPAGLPPLTAPVPITTAALDDVPTRGPSPIDVPALTVEPLADVAEASPGLP
jgi:hypothetical protein